MISCKCSSWYILSIIYNSTSLGKFDITTTTAAAPAAAVAAAAAAEAKAATYNNVLKRLLLYVSRMANALEIKDGRESERLALL